MKWEVKPGFYPSGCEGTHPANGRRLGPTGLTVSSSASITSRKRWP